MGSKTNIEWCDRSFNGWTGCSKVSPGCDNCYAESWAKRSGIVQWGHGSPRRRTSEANWKAPMKWNDQAQHFSECTACGARGIMLTGCGACGHWQVRAARQRVFCASLADWLDEEVPAVWLAELLALVRDTPNLDWLLLTKRPGNWKSRLAAAHASGRYGIGTGGHTIIEDWLDGMDPPNVWIGTTVENQDMADKRIPQLLSIPARVRFLSCEPLLGFTDIQQVGDDNLTIYWPLIGRAISDGMNEPADLLHGGIHWVICGGESGPKARPMHPKWARAIRDQCAAAGIPFLFKQWGEWVPITPLYDGRDEDAEDGTDPDRCAVIRTDGSEWPLEWGQPPLEGSPHIVERVGKKAAGRLLDGREHLEFPNL